MPFSAACTRIKNLSSSPLSHRYIAHTILASASIRFLSAFSPGVSTCRGTFTVFVRLAGSTDRSSEVVDRIVDVDRTDIASFSDILSEVDRYVLVIADVMRSLDSLK